MQEVEIGKTAQPPRFFPTSVLPILPMTAALLMNPFEFTINWVTRVLYTIVALALFLCVKTDAKSVTK